MKKHLQKFFLVVTTMALMLSTGFAVQAEEIIPVNQIDKLNSSVQQSFFYDEDSGKIQIDVERVAKLHSISMNEEKALKEANKSLSELSKEETEKIIIDSGYNPDELEDGEYFTNAVPIILVGIGLIIFYFSYAKYLDYLEKRALIRGCYDMGGYPVVDSRDTSGLNGQPNVYEAQRIGGYNFACMQNPQ
ncbi:hypothetical protein [Psychrobacillus vulpis]|uniref:Uncharacterized protein n=1 Tax=Psychrobacillus vulpis TaxID=2325572 RepID=A0A544TDI7_9BACI|nr:hypothetical protein [Psychrobacillus vulpis]TQR15510.1 hypothetical protein FG384_19255 [Psychrobacillus vulpis]